MIPEYTYKEEGRGGGEGKGERRKKGRQGSREGGWESFLLEKDKV